MNLEGPRLASSEVRTLRIEDVNEDVPYEVRSRPESRNTRPEVSGKIGTKPRSVLGYT